MNSGDNRFSFLAKYSRYTLFFLYFVLGNLVHELIVQKCKFEGYFLILCTGKLPLHVYDCEFQKSVSSQYTMLHNHRKLRPTPPTHPPPPPHCDRDTTSKANNGYLTDLGAHGGSAG